MRGMIATMVLAVLALAGTAARAEGEVMYFSVLNQRSAALTAQ